MGVYLDQLVFPGVDYPSSYNNAKQFVFHQIYGYLPGGAPIPYIVSSFNLVSVYLVPFAVFVISFAIFKVRSDFERLSNSNVYYVVLYLNFYGAIVLVSGSLFDYLFRSFIPVVAILFSSRIVLRKHLHRRLN
jgi:hypothetical protein